MGEAGLVAILIPTAMIFVGIVSTNRRLNTMAERFAAASNLPFSRFEQRCEAFEKTLADRLTRFEQTLDARLRRIEDQLKLR